MPSRATTFGNLSEAIGPDAARTLLAFFDGQQPTLYVPGCYHPGHLLERILGQSAFLRLIAARGDETIMLVHARMEPERRAGAVYRGMRAGLSTREIAEQIGCSYRRVRQIETAIRAGAPLTAIARADGVTA
jgi:hypothetical protein